LPFLMLPHSYLSSLWLPAGLSVKRAFDGMLLLLTTPQTVLFSCPLESPDED
jgi:hypothetical protein